MKKYKLIFTGQGFEFFSIFICLSLFTVCTLGVGLPFLIHYVIKFTVNNIEILRNDNDGK